MSRRGLYIGVVVALCVCTALGLLLTGTQGGSALAAPRPSGPVGPLPDALKGMPEQMKANHGMFDNALTAMYEQWLAGETVTAGPGAGSERSASPFSPLYGPDVRVSNAAFAGSQNEFQVDINPTNSLFAVGASNDGRTAGVGIYATSNGGLTWTAQDAPIGTSACCDPAVAYAFNGTVYVGVLDTSPAGAYTLRSTNNGASWTNLGLVALPDRNNLVVDNSPLSPRQGTIYITYSDLPTSNRIKGYKSTDGGMTWGTSFFVGGPAPASGYQQSSQPRVAVDGTLYVGYQQYLNSSQGCNAGVENVVARSTDGGATFTHSVLPVIQGGACTSAQSGRGIFCINAGGSSFRSRSHPIMATHPTNAAIVYMVYSGGDLETGYTCGTATGFHADTLFRKSTNSGVTWSAPVKINTDPAGKDQYYPWIDVSPNGRIWVGWHDRREDASNFQHKWYQAFSNNEGATWTEAAVADVPSQPSTFIGDYAGIAAENDRVLGMWWDSRSTASGDPYTDPDAPLGPTFTPTATGTPTRTSTATRTPTPTSTRVVDLAGLVTWTNNCTTPIILRMQTFINGPTFMRTAQPSTMRARNNAGEILDVPVPFLDATTPSYTFDCIVGSCVPSSWSTSLPITLTVDFFNVVFEHDETNNVSTVNFPPPIPTPCPPNTSTPTRTATPINLDAYAFFQPSGPITITQGSKLTLDLLVHAGSHNVTAAQNYLTFTNSVLQVVNVGSPGCVVTSTLTPDAATFDAVLQNQVCNGNLPCDFGSLVAPPASIAFASGALNNPPATGEFRVAQIAFCANAVGTARLHWEFAPPAPPERHTGVVDKNGNFVSNPTLHADYIINVVPPSATTLTGHVTVQGRPAQPHPLQSVPVTLTLKSGATEVNYTGLTTDPSGFFTVTAPAPGLYSWRVKTAQTLANAGSVNLAVGSNSQEMGLLLNGDANNDNCASAADFNIVRSTFGLALGDPNYDSRADFTGNDVVNASDFNLLRGNFGFCGAAPIGPARTHIGSR